MKNVIYGAMGILFSGLLSAQLSLTEQGMASDFDGDGQRELIQIIRSDSSGSGIFYYLSAIDARENGELRFDSLLIGDRVQFLNFWKDKNTIALDMVQAGEGDAACCPTHKVVRRWELKDGKLHELPIEPYGQVSIKDLVRLKWRLTRMNNSVMAKDVNITMTFGDKQIGGQSSCNNYITGVEEASSGELKIQAPMVASLMACPSEKMDMEQQFFTRLGQVYGYRWMGDSMAFDWRADGKSGSLVFRLVKE